MVSTPAADVEADTAAFTAPEWVVFTCAEHRFAVPVERLREILLPRPFTRMPGCGPEVCGLFGLRGRVVTALDFGAALALRPAAARPDHRLLLVEHDERLVALAVERVIGVARSETPELSLPGEALRALDVERGDVIGIGASAERAFVAIDPNTVVDRLLA